MPRFEDLDVEVAAQIFEYVVDTSPDSALNFALTSKFCYASAKLGGYRYKNLSYNHHGPSAELQGWLHNEELLRGLRHLEVRHARTRSPRLTSYDNLVTLIEKAGNLKSLTWTGEAVLPSEVLEALHKHHKKASLGVFDFYRSDQTADESDPNEIALAHTPALTGIRVKIWANGKFPDLRQAAFERIVANAPNLKFASISQGAQGCVIHSISQEQADLQTSLAEKFHTQRRPNSSLRHLTLDGFNLNEQTLRNWGRFVDLSNLESIKCSRGYPDVSYFRYAPRVLTNMKHLSLNLYGREDISDELESYLSTCASLESISLWSWRKTISLTTVLTSHGPTLKTLQLHERETTASLDDQDRRQALSVEEVKAIREACPNLKDLTIDCDRHTQELETEIETDGVLQVLSQMHLSKLQIYYDLGLAHLANSAHFANVMPASRPLEDAEVSDEESDEASDNASDAGEDEETQQNAEMPPSGTKEMRRFVSNLWKFIFAAGHYAPKRTLELKFGEWERKLGIGYPVRWAIDEQHLKTRWTAEPHERDDKADTCVVHGSGATLRCDSDSDEED